MRVFLTGATGFVGRNVLQWLLENVPDARIECLVRSWEKAALLPEDPRVKIIYGDLLKPETYKRDLVDEEIVIHTAALVSLRNGPEFYEANVEATRNLLNISAQRKALKRFVFVGSISSYEHSPEEKNISEPLTENAVPFPSTDYGKSKLQAQHMVATSGLPYSVMIPSYIYGPYPRLKSSMDRIIYDVRDGKPYTKIPLPGCATQIYAPDLAEAIWLGATHPQCQNQTFFVGNHTPVKVGDAYAAIAQGLGMAYKPRDVSPEAIARLKKLVYQKRPNEAFVKVLFENYFWASSEKLSRLTGWQPRHTLAEGVEKTLLWYRQNGLL